MNTFFTADEHLGHANKAGGIIAMCNRPFVTLEEMEEELIARHNSVVKPGDTVIHVGDMFWRKWTTAQCIAYMSRLNGMHEYVNGNHEEAFNRPDSAALKRMFVSIRDVRMVKVGKQLIWVSHYAHRVWPKSHQGSYHVYGHTHGVLPGYRRSMDVGVDANNFTPVSFEQLDEYMKNLGTLPPDEVEQDMLDHPWPKDHLPEGSH